MQFQVFGFVGAAGAGGGGAAVTVFAVNPVALLAKQFFLYRLLETLPSAVDVGIGLLVVAACLVKFCR